MTLAHAEESTVSALVNLACQLEIWLRCMHFLRVCEQQLDKQGAQKSELLMMVADTHKENQKEIEITVGSMINDVELNLIALTENGPTRMSECLSDIYKRLCRVCQGETSTASGVQVLHGGDIAIHNLQIFASFLETEAVVFGIFSDAHKLDLTVGQQCSELKKVYDDFENNYIGNCKNGRSAARKRLDAYDSMLKQERAYTQTRSALHLKIDESLAHLETLGNLARSFNVPTQEPVRVAVIAALGNMQTLLYNLKARAKNGLRLEVPAPKKHALREFRCEREATLTALLYQLNPKALYASIA